MLSFLDDIFDILWRHKVSSHPYLLLMVYYAEHGKTNVVVPLPLRFMFGTVIDFGTFYLSCAMNLSIWNFQLFRITVLHLRVLTIHILNKRH